MQVGIVNLLLETHGGARRQGDATWYLPILQPFFCVSLLVVLAHLGSCLSILILFHQVEFAAMFLLGKRNDNLF